MTAPTPAARVPGLDVLRLLAIAAVSVQHLLSIAHHDTGPQWLGINPGDVGVGLFCAVAGTLAAQPAAMALSPGKWLLRRLRRVLPAYWIVLSLSFLLALATNYKPITLPLFLAQFAGVAPFFYDTAQLINQSTWFVCLILVCYFACFLGRVLHAPRLGLGVAVGVALGMMLWHRGDTHLPVQIATFWIAARLATFASKPAAGTGQSRFRQALPTLITGIALILLGPLLTWRHPAHPDMWITALPGLCLLILGLALAGAPRGLSPLRVPASLVYEYFLVHGIFFVAAARQFPAHAIAAGVFLAIPAAVLAAAALHYLLGRVVTPGAQTKEASPAPAGLQRQPVAGR
jgi:peptidoglycan/LPS O-acetylase OafA/YrhL